MKKHTPEQPVGRGGTKPPYRNPLISFEGGTKPPTAKNQTTTKGGTKPPIKK